MSPLARDHNVTGKDKENLKSVIDLFNRGSFDANTLSTLSKLLKVPKFLSKDAGYALTDILKSRKLAVNLNTEHNDMRSDWSEILLTPEGSNQGVRISVIGQVKVDAVTITEKDLGMGNRSRLWN